MHGTAVQSVRQVPGKVGCIGRSKAIAEICYSGRRVPADSSEPRLCPGTPSVDFEGSSARTGRTLYGCPQAHDPIPGLRRAASP